MGYLDAIEKKPSSAKTRFYLNEYKKFVDASVNKRERMARNFGLYSGVDYKQWDDEAVNQLLQERRPVTSFNLTQKMIDTVQGSLEQNPYDTYFDPPLSARDLVDEVNFLQETYDRDADICNWPAERAKFILNGLIYEGVIEQYIDYRYDSLGIIGRKSINPFHFIEDPFWQTDNEEDCRMIFKWSWMTAQQIMDTYGKKDENLAALISMYEEMGDTSGERELDKLCDRSGEFFDQLNNRYKVIECVYMKQVEKKRIFDRREKQFLDIEDEKIQEALVRTQGDSLFILPERRSVCKVFTFCPAISYELVLADGDHPMQIGRLPFYTWSAKNMFGERQGLVDVFADAQVTMNKRESMVTHYQTTAANGGILVEDDAFEDDAEFNRFVRDRNSPGQVFKVRSGALREGKIAPINRGEFPQDLILSSQRAEAFMEKVSSVVAATQAKSEGANESGILFNQKLAQSLVPLEMMNKSIQSVEHNMAVGYFFAFKQVYSDIPRVFNSRKNNTVVAINQPRPDGTMYNDVAKIPRFDVRIIQSRSGMNKKREELMKWKEISVSFQNPLLRSESEKYMLDYTDLPESKIEQAKKDADLFVQFQRKQMELQIAQMDASLQQLRAPMAPQLGLEANVSGEGLPPGAKEISSAPTQGNLPMNLAGGENISNNRKAPSDVLG